MLTATLIKDWITEDNWMKVKIRKDKTRIKPNN